jgi:hypothetical protein
MHRFSIFGDHTTQKNIEGLENKDNKAAEKKINKEMAKNNSSLQTIYTDNVQAFRFFLPQAMAWMS